MSTKKITIQEAKTKKALKAFLRFPWQIYRGDPFWVPPLLKEHAFHFSPKHPFLHHALPDITCRLSRFSMRPALSHSDPLLYRKAIHPII